MRSWLPCGDCINTIKKLIPRSIMIRSLDGGGTKGPPVGPCPVVWPSASRGRRTGEVATVRCNHL